MHCNAMHCSMDGKVRKCYISDTVLLAYLNDMLTGSVLNTAPLLKLIVLIRFIQSWVCLESVQMNNFHFAFRTALDSVHDLVYPFYHFLPLRIKQSNFIILLALMNVQQFFLKLVNVILNVLALACWKSKDNITCKSKFSTKQKFR